MRREWRGAASVIGGLAMLAVLLRVFQPRDDVSGVAVLFLWLFLYILFNSFIEQR